MFQICRIFRPVILKNVRFQHRKPSFARPAETKDSTGMKWALLVRFKNIWTYAILKSK